MRMLVSCSGPVAYGPGNALAGVRKVAPSCTPAREMRVLRHALRGGRALRRAGGRATVPSLGLRRRPCLCGGGAARAHFAVAIRPLTKMGAPSSACSIVLSGTVKSTLPGSKTRHMLDPP